jgi:hypothetical protein
VSRYRGDSLATFDLRLDRVSIFDGQGRFARSYNLAGHAGLSPLPLGPLSDGSFALMAPRYQTPDGVALDSAYCLRFSPDGSGVDTVALLPDQERYGFSIGEAFMSGSVAFTPFAVGAARRLPRGRRTLQRQDPGEASQPARPSEDVPAGVG